MLSVSVILPVYNAEPWLNQCLQSVYTQQVDGATSLQLSAYNDCSSDNSHGILETWRDKLQEHGIQVRLGGHSTGGPKGVGYAKNRAIEQSDGDFLCFLDADDVMHPERVARQLSAAVEHKDALIGCRFHREPAGSTDRFTRWANTLTPEQLYTQVYTSHGPTIIMPTWFCHRDVFNQVPGGFDEGGKGTPEDLLFFYHHLSLGGKLHRVDTDLLMYRYHQQAATFSVEECTIWACRMQAIQDTVISSWDSFTIWNAGKQGRRFYRSLSHHNRNKVAMFCDVDEKKIAKGVYTFEESPEQSKPCVPIVHFSKARPPFIICVKQDLTDGGFEENLASLELQEGKDYVHFN